jgi:hypothetical protein
MKFKSEISNLIFSLFFISLGGWMLHFRIHPIIDSNPAHYVPFVFGLLNILFVPFLLNSKTTFLPGYLINGFGAIIGVIVMTAFSLSALPSSLTISNIFFKTTLADIFLLLPKLFLGQLILLHYFPTGLGRMFTNSWWIRHFFYLTIIFAMGHILWS